MSVSFRQSRVLCGILLFLLFFAAKAFAVPQVEWLPGFPQRMGNQTILMWKPLPGAKRYVISRTEEVTKKVVTWEMSDNSYVDQRSELGKSYSYQIVALGADGRPLGASSLAQLEEYHPLTPPVWGGSYQDGAKIYLVWEGDIRSVYYNIYKARQGEPPKVLTASSTNRYVDTDIAKGATYIYTVRSVDKAGKESEASDQLVVTVEGFGAKTAEPEVAHHYVETTLLALKGGATLREPTDIEVFDHQLFVTDLGSRSVAVITADGQVLRHLATKPPEYVGDWGIPWGIGRDREGRRFAVAFLRTPNVRVFGIGGDMLLDILLYPPKGFEDSPIIPQPMDVAIDGVGGLWVTDYAFGQVIHLDKRGYELGRVGTPKIVEKAEPFRSPTFVTVNPKSGEILVVDSLQAKIFRISKDGQLIGTWSRDVQKEGALTLPKGLAALPDGKLLVVDGMLSSLQRLDEKGNVEAVYLTKDVEAAVGEKTKREILATDGIVAPAMDEETGDIYLTSKVRNGIYLLHTPEAAQ
jgi:hypothetical protein